MKTDTAEPVGDGDQMALFPVRSDLASVKKAKRHQKEKSVR